MSADATGFAWKYSPTKKGTLLVHLALADVANDMHSNELWCSVDTVSRKTRLNRTTVMNALQEMIEAGVLELLEERPGRTNRYRMLYPNLPVVFSDTPREGSDSGVAESDITRRETRHELKGSLANQRDRVGKCDRWADVEGAKAPTVAPCILDASHDGLCEALKPLELVRERKDTA